MATKPNQSVTKEHVGFRLPSDLITRLKVTSAETRRPMSDIVEESLRDSLKYPSGGTNTQSAAA